MNTIEITIFLLLFATIVAALAARSKLPIRSSKNEIGRKISRLALLTPRENRWVRIMILNELARAIVI